MKKYYNGKLMLLTFLPLLWLILLIFAFYQNWEVDYSDYLLEGVILYIVSIWLYAAIQIKNKYLTIGLTLLSCSQFVDTLDELKTLQMPESIDMIFEKIILIAAFLVMTIGIKKIVENNHLSIQKMKNIAYYDYLTNLPNRRAINKRVEDLIEASNKEGNQLAIYLLDFDNFKSINDTYGHEFGDRVLVNMARQMDAMFTDDFFWGRFGGDEFLVVQKNVKNEEDIDITSKKIIQCFDKIHHVDNYPVHMSTSIGVSVYPKDGNSKSMLFRKADMALYQVKNTSKNGYGFYASNLELSNGSHDMKIDIINGLENNEFEVYYQPIVSLSDEKISNFEALARWYRPYGVVTPASFIPRAEMYGLIKDIDFYVLRRVCEDYKSFRNHGYSNVSINLSANTITKPDLIKEIQKLIEEFTVCPTFLTFEITETAIIRDESKTLSNIKALKNLGCKVSLDDFGTGYSSLNYLKNFPVDSLKIDKTFIDGIWENPKDDLVVTAVLFLANNLGIETIAEGVEYKEQVEFLDAHGCHKFQGYYFGKPMRLEELLTTNVEELIS